MVLNPDAKRRLRSTIEKSECRVQTMQVSLAQGNEKLNQTVKPEFSRSVWSDGGWRITWGIVLSPFFLEISDHFWGLGQEPLHTCHLSHGPIISLCFVSVFYWVFFSLDLWGAGDRGARLCLSLSFSKQIKPFAEFFPLSNYIVYKKVIRTL